MRYRRAGTTDLTLSEIAFGCGGNAGLMVRGGFQEQLHVVGRALDLGINYFDNAPDYGNGAAEENLGRVLKEIGQKPVLNSKVEIRPEDLNDMAGHVVRSAEASLHRLGVDHLDVLQIHNGPAAAPAREGNSYRTLWIEDFMRPGGAIDGLQRLIRDGKVRYVGFICRGGDATEARKLLRLGMFHIINLPYSLLNPTARLAATTDKGGGDDCSGVLGDCQECGVGTAIFSPLAGGVLTDEFVTGAARHALARPHYNMSADALARVRAQVTRLKTLSQTHGLSLTELAYRFLLNHPGVTSVIGGFSSVAQLEEVAAYSDRPALAGNLATQIAHM